jgi:hypothetical protein
MQKDGDIAPIIQSLLSFPQISGNQNKIFFGRSIVIGKAYINDDSFLYDTRIRLDEVRNDICKIENSCLIKCTIHGDGPKDLQDGIITHSVIHGETKMHAVHL